MKTASRKMLLSQLRYNSRTGLFHWKVAGFGRQFNKPAGSIERPLGYVRICVHGKRHLAHRLAWLFMTGHWPKQMVDHKDRNPTNNKWSNLREATNAQNQHNSIGKCRSIAGKKGVLWNPALEKWDAKIFCGKQIYLGHFDSVDEAHAAYVTAAKKHFGDFARAR